MFRLSNNLIGVLNFVTFLLSLPILGGGIWLATRGGVTDCEKFLQTPLILIGVFFMLVSLAGLVGACCRNSLLLSIYLSVMFILIVVLTVFTVFAFVVTNKGAGEVTSNRGYKEYRLGDYSHWLQKRVENSKNWARIRACLSEAKVCQSLRESNQTFNQFISDNLSPIEVPSTPNAISMSIPDAANPPLNATSITKTQLSGLHQRRTPIQATPTAVPGATTSRFSATTADLAKPASSPTQRTSGRRLPSSTSSSLSSS
ncbi:tetraspanin-8-like isoform X2 [Zingiber officinale]|uniref:tetraspanin-8-like isoform X2 n=1 Tax=Zingiber officinale TaxID=94328 RepID=UPI001C4CBB60|nr:tetraspanin-8-like isoform X2 [Zingiber officinale]